MQLIHTECTVHRSSDCTTVTNYVFWQFLQLAYKHKVLCSNFNSTFLRQRRDTYRVFVVARGDVHTVALQTHTLSSKKKRKRERERGKWLKSESWRFSHWQRAAAVTATSVPILDELCSSLQFSPRRVKRSPSPCGQVTLLAERRLRQIEEVNDDTHLAGTLMCGGCPRSAGAFGIRTFHTVRNVRHLLSRCFVLLFFFIIKKAPERTVQTSRHSKRNI